MEYSTYQRNHVIFPNREADLENFLKSTIHNGMQHKWEYGVNPHSEDALTWSCFDALRCLPAAQTIKALNEMMEDAYEGKCNFLFSAGQDVRIEVGKTYAVPNFKEKTEVDASVETSDRLVFIEAKLYSHISLPNENHPHDQIARKIRVGAAIAQEKGLEFYFIFLDVAPLRKLYQNMPKEEALKNTSHGFYDKWKSAWWFDYYKNGRNGSMRPLHEALNGVKHPPLEEVAQNMGWLTWSDLFKITLRAVVSK